MLHELAHDLADQIRSLGADASEYTLDVTHPLEGEPLTLTGPEGQLIDLGRVGRVTGVNSDRIAHTTDYGRTVPVIPSLARTIYGGWLNVNADTAAAAVAGAMKAESCLFLSDTPGVLRDVGDPRSLLPRLTRAECRTLIADGVISGGMLPKVEACFEALDAGAGRAVILDGRDPYALLRGFVSDEPAGTAIVP